MKDLELEETCECCGEHLTLVESVRAFSGDVWLVKRCLNCGGHPVEEVLPLRKSKDEN